MRKHKLIFGTLVSAIVLLLLVLTVVTLKKNEGYDFTRSNDLIVSEHQMTTVDLKDRLKKSRSQLLEERAKHTVNQMSLDEKIGQLIIGGFEETTVTTETEQLIKEYKIGGFILLRRNLETPQQSLTLVNELKLTNEINHLPLLLSIDQEGGRVTRLPQLSNIPSPSQVVEQYDEEGGYLYGQLLGEQLKAFGLQLNFAPVLDINSNPNNPVIDDRSFGSTANVVSHYGIQTMKGMQDSGVIPTLKHFPGHGDTETDSHDSLPIINKTSAELLHTELKPFIHAIQHGADTIMTAHILIPKLDHEYPVTLSHTLIQEFLRDTLQFNGVVITDDMTMGAITTKYRVDEAGLLALKAGVDIILIVDGYDHITSTIETIKQAVIEGDLSEERIDESVTRIIMLKYKYNVNDDLVQHIDIDSLNEAIVQFNQDD